MARFSTRAPTYLICTLWAWGALGSSLVDQYRTSSDQWPEFVVDESVVAKELAPIPPLPEVAWHTPETENLGKLLFFDPRLSTSRQVACVSCHHPSLGWTDGRRVSAGHGRQEGTRNAMSLINVAYFNQLFWDGRADGLLDLMLRPIESPLEMNSDIASVLQRLNEIDGYQPLLKEAFDDTQWTPERLAIALASWVRTRVSRLSEFDRFMKGEYERLSDKQIRGLHLFRTQARCMNCHNGPLLSDGQFHHTGLSYYARRFEDLGRFEATADPEDRGKFRTPSLRDLRFTGPWMHNGLFTNFTGILRMYNHGVTFNSRVQKKEGAPKLSPLIQPLGMTTEQIDDLESFLQSLSKITFFVETPQLPDYDPFELEVVGSSNAEKLHLD